ncbi:hypothetical protein PTKIN_Ptkin17bG0123700 [Pterospermum kingtungense]
MASFSVVGFDRYSNTMTMESVPEVITGVSLKSGLTLEWIKRKNLGVGSHGVVDLIEIINPVPHQLAVKYSPYRSPSLEKEYRVLQRFLGCPNIVQCYDQIMTVDQYEVEYHNLFLDYAADGDLLDLMKKYGGKIPESHARRYTTMILQGLCEVHGRGYVHCDIKPDNILVYPSRAPGSLSSLKIADFGAAMEPEERDEPPARRFRGTIHYMSPESVEGGKISGAMDIWSLGCVVFEMMTGELPWQYCAHDVEDLLKKIATGSLNTPQNLSMAGRDFLVRCLARDPRKRWSADMLMTHPFVFADSPFPARPTGWLQHALMRSFNGLKI